MSEREILGMQIAGVIVQKKTDSKPREGCMARGSFTALN